MVGRPEKPLSPKAIVQSGDAGARSFQVSDPCDAVDATLNTAGTRNTRQPSHPSTDNCLWQAVCLRSTKSSFPNPLRLEQMLRLVSRCANWPIARRSVSHHGCRTCSFRQTRAESQIPLIAPSTPVDTSTPSSYAPPAHARLASATPSTATYPIDLTSTEGIDRIDGGDSSLWSAGRYFKQVVSTHCDSRHALGPSSLIHRLRPLRPIFTAFFLYPSRPRILAIRISCRRS